MNVSNQCPSLFPICQDFRNSQARNAAGGLEAFHQPLPAEECPVTGTSWASSVAVRASSGRHQSHGGQRGQAQTVKHTQPLKPGTWQTNATQLLNRRWIVCGNFLLIQRTEPTAFCKGKRMLSDIGLVFSIVHNLCSEDFFNLGDAEPWRENGLKWQSVFLLQCLLVRFYCPAENSNRMTNAFSLSKYIVHDGTCIFVNKRKGEKLNSINNIFGEPIICDSGSHVFFLYALMFPLRRHHRGEQTLELELILWSSHTTWNHSSWLCWVYLHSCTK